MKQEAEKNITGIELSITPKAILTEHLRAEQEDKVQALLDGLAAGECKGVKGATAYKIAEYAQKKGLV